MNEVKKFCGDCNTTKTPLWRSGPNGPRSLCNACGIRYRKRKMAEDKQDIRGEKSCSSRSDDYDDDENQIDESLKMRYDDYSNMGNDRMFVQKSSSSSSKMKKQRSNSEQSISSSNRNLGEVEQAAALLMFLSWGSFFA